MESCEPQITHNILNALRLNFHMSSSQTDATEFANAADPKEKEARTAAKETSLDANNFKDDVWSRRTNEATFCRPDSSGSRRKYHIFRFDHFSCMRSEGFSFYIGALAVETGSLDAALVSATRCGRPCFRRNVCTTVAVKLVEGKILTGNHETMVSFYHQT